MLAQNPCANLLALNIEPSQADRLSLRLHCGSETFGVGDGQVRVGLVGWQLELQPGAVSPVTIAHVPLLEAIDHRVAQQWEDFYPDRSGNHWRGFWVLSEVLQGTIALGEIPTQVLDFTLSARVTAVDLRVIESSGLWHHDISPNAHGILERLVIRALMPCLPQPLSQVGGNLLGEIPSPLPDFKETIAALTAHPADLGKMELQKLLQVAQLNPRQDLVGINWMGGDLRNVDLSNADLTRSNLRGADLSDGDFTETNFHYARLSGADLSGALLSSVNLQGANLHRASLALCNLNGADLRGADLRGANLSQATLRGARVEGSHWGENEGLSPEIEAELKAGGALLT